MSLVETWGSASGNCSELIASSSQVLGISGVFVFGFCPGAEKIKPHNVNTKLTQSVFVVNRRLFLALPPRLRGKNLWIPMNRRDAQIAEETLRGSI